MVLGIVFMSFFVLVCLCSKDVVFKMVSRMFVNVVVFLFCIFELYWSNVFDT